MPNTTANRRLQELSADLDKAIAQGLTYATWAKIYDQARRAAGGNREALGLFEGEAEDGWLSRFFQERAAGRATADDT